MVTYLNILNCVDNNDAPASRVSSVTAYKQRQLPRTSINVCKLKNETACLARRSSTATESVGAASNHAYKTETNATKSEVTVALAHTHTHTNTEGMLLSLTEICTGMQFHQGEHTAVEYSESGSEG